MNLIDMDKLRKDLMAKGDIPIHEVFNTIWDQPIIKAIPKTKIEKAIERIGKHEKDGAVAMDYVEIILEEACDE